MGIDYDAWLEKPYQEAAERADFYDKMAEQYMDSDEFDSDAEEWAKAKGLTEYDWQDYAESDEFEAVVEKMMDNYEWGDV